MLYPTFEGNVQDGTVRSMDNFELRQFSTCLSTPSLLPPRSRPALTRGLARPSLDAYQRRAARKLIALTRETTVIQNKVCKLRSTRSANWHMGILFHSGIDPRQSMALDLRKTPDLHHFDLETDKLGRIRCEFITGDLLETEKTLTARERRWTGFCPEPARKRRTAFNR